MNGEQFFIFIFYLFIYLFFFLHTLPAFIIHTNSTYQRVKPLFEAKEVAHLKDLHHPAGELDVGAKVWSERVDLLARVPAGLVVKHWVPVGQC